MQGQTKLARPLAGVIAVIAGGAVLGQLAINIAHPAVPGRPPWLSLLLLYGYFTIWTNTLVAVVAGAFAAGKGGFLTRPGTLAATMVYIIVVGAIYNTLLVGSRPLAGATRVVDFMLHTVVPLSYSLWWLFCVPRGRLAWAALLPALAFPLAYGLVAMTQSWATGKYAYFFIDIGKFGLPVVLGNIAGLALLHGALMAAVIVFDRRAGRGAAPGSAR